MLRSFRDYGRWVLLPVATAFILGHIQTRRTAQDRSLASEAHFARIADLLFREEMASQAADLAEEAVVLENPDQASSVVQAALSGDTVAALGTLSGRLTLSVALGEEIEPGEGVSEEPPTLRVRGATGAFPALFLTRLHNRAGHSASLYFRGMLVDGRGSNQGPDSLTAERLAPKEGYPVPVPTSTGVAALLPIGQAPLVPATLHILVASSTPTLPSPPPPTAAWPPIVGAALGLGALLWMNRGKTNPGALPSWALPLFAFGTATCGLWAGLLGPGRDLEKEVAETQRREMVQTLALVAEGMDTLGLRGVAQATGYGVHELRDGSPVFSTQAGPGLSGLLGLPSPDPAFPSTGVTEVGGETLRFASQGRSDGTVLVLTRPTRETRIRDLLLKLSLLGGIASLLGLVFLSSSHSRRDRADRPPTQTGAPGP